LGVGDPVVVPHSIDCALAEGEEARRARYLSLFADEIPEGDLTPNMINVGMPSQVKYGYMRQGLVEGMIHEDKLGTYPFKYGIVAGSDSHSAYSPNEEFNFHS
jgi:hypothetical protein